MEGPTLILDGTRSGESTFTESLLSDEPGVSYVATSEVRPGSPEWVGRLKIHRARRPSHWETAETIDLAAEPRRDDATPMLVGCLGVWLTRLLDDGYWDRDPKTLGHLENRLKELLATLHTTRRPVVFASDEVGLGVAPTTSPGRSFTNQLGYLSMRATVVIDQVWLCVVGILMPVKGA